METINMTEEKSKHKKSLLLVYTNFGIGGIARSLVELLHLPDMLNYDITLYIRRDDVLDLIHEIPDWVKAITVRNDVKSLEFEKDFFGRIAKCIYTFIKKRHTFAAKKFIEFYKRPKQRKREEAMLSAKGLYWDVAISYSTDGDDPIFVQKCTKAGHKYVFVHQSTLIDKKNLKAMREFDGIVIVNPLLIPWIQKTVGSDVSISALENYVNPTVLNRLANAKKITAAQDILLLSTCGRICMTKGYDLLVQTALLLKERGIWFHWYWIGDGPDRTKFEKLIKEAGLEEEIIITGMLNNPFPYMNACHVYVQPSRAEAYTMAIVEALILCKPIVSTKTAAAERIFQKFQCGFPVKADPPLIAGEIIRLLSDSSL